MSRPAFVETESRRQPFDSARTHTVTQTPQPSWRPGDGLNDHAARADFEVGTHAFHRVQPGVTQYEPAAMYKLMIGGISPRPVALVSTLDKNGVANLAPVSWYQMVSHDPPLIMVSFGGPEGRRKDSELNIEATKEFTVSSCNEPFAEALNYASINAPPGVSEYDLSGLTPVRSALVSPPRVGESPFSLECVVDFTRSYTSPSHTSTLLVIARVVMLHVRSDAVQAGGSVDVGRTLPLTRIGGMLYARLGDGFELRRPTWEEEAGGTHKRTPGEWEEQQGQVLERFP